MFDSNAYRKEVLKPLLESGDRTFDDPFLLLAVDPTTDDTSAIRQQIDAVVAFWRKEQASPRYKNLVTALLKKRNELSGPLLDPTERGRLRQRVVGERQAQSEARFLRLDEMLNTLEGRLGGIPRSRIERLRATARRSGVTDAEFDARLGRHVVLDDVPEDLAPPPAPIRRQVRELLEELGHLEDDRPDLTHRSLFEFLGVPDSASRVDILARHELLGERNRRRRHERLRTVVDELLALTSTLLLTGDPRRYRAGLLEDVADILRPEMETMVLLEDRLTPASSEHLIRQAVAAGLSAQDAQALIVRLAKELGAPIETGSAVDYVTCAACRSAVPLGGDRRACPACGSDLYRSCPRCRREVARTLVRCPGCELGLAAYDQAVADVAAAKAELDGGHVEEAHWRLRQLGSEAELLADAVALRRDIETARQAAVDSWQRLATALDEGRHDDGEVLVRALERQGADVPGPGGLTLDVARGAISSAQSELRRKVADAGGRAIRERERALIELATEHPGSSVVLAALRDVPVAAPSRVTAKLTGRSVRISWRRSAAIGPIEYRVFRTSHEAGQPTVAGRPVGSTAETALEDAGATLGSLVTYEVQAVRHGIGSGHSATAELFVATDVDRLTAVEHDGAVELRWTRLNGSGEVWVERADATDSTAPTVRMRGSQQGSMDTRVQHGHRYRYRVVVEYRTPAGTPVRTDGREVGATAFVLPRVPEIVEVVTSRAQVRVRPTPAERDTSVRVLRADTEPVVKAGSSIDARRLGAIGVGLRDASGVAVDRADGRPRWYVAVAVAGSHAVTSSSVVHPGVGEATGVGISSEGDGLTVRWAWPDGCTECLVAWRSHAPPTGADDAEGMAAKITNTKYELQGGCRLPDPPPGWLHVLILPVGRIGARTQPLTAVTTESRAAYMCPDRHDVTYRVRQGRRRRGTKVEVIGGQGARPELVVVGGDGPEPPISVRNGIVLGTVAPIDRLVTIPTEQVRSQMVLAVLPSSDEDRAVVRISHPPLEERTIR